MELPLLLAKIISVIYISSGVAVLIGTINFNDIADDFDKSPALTFIAGSVGIIIGMVLINFHNNWVSNWTVLVTIISWAFLIGGLIVVIFPKSLSYFSRYYKHSHAWGIFMILFGAVFGYFGFIK